MSREASSTTSSASRIVRDVFAGAIDYAGLFPPAALDMRTAVRNYVSYRGGGDRLLLGWFVVPAARVDELEAELVSLDLRDIRASAVLGPNPIVDLDAAAAFNARANRTKVDAVEARVDRPAAIYELAAKG